MFAAASGARLAHRHNKTVKKQMSASQIEGLHVQYKAFQKQHQLKHSDVHGSRYAGVARGRPHRKFSSANCDSGLKLSSSYVDINGRISKLGHVDFEGKAAWQERELHELEARESICAPNDAAVTHRTKQREAHRRWVKRNRIHDLSFEDCSSEDEEVPYGVQNGAANLLLYVGLGTMCVGMIIAFVGTGEKGFKTMELRLIGPSLIGAGVLIILLRIMLCVCPSKCLRLKKQKQKLKNSTNKLNSEGKAASRELCSSKEPLGAEPSEEKQGKKRVSIAMLPTTSGLSTNSSEEGKPPRPESPPRAFPVPAISFWECEKPSGSKASGRKASDSGSSREEEEEGGGGGGGADLEPRRLEGTDADVASFGSQTSCGRNSSDVPEALVSPDEGDVSITSLVEVSPVREPKPNASKFETTRNPKNRIPTEIVLSPSNLNEPKETE